MITVENLGVRFGAFEAVKGVSFTVPRGSSLGIVGESGSGKSTVLRALSGLNDDWTGRMSIDGIRLASRRNRDFFRRVQMVFQDPYGSLHPRQTVDRALSEPLAVHRIDDGETRVLHALDRSRAALGSTFPLSSSAFRRATPTCGHCPRPDLRTRCAAAG